MRIRDPGTVGAHTPMLRRGRPVCAPVQTAASLTRPFPNAISQWSIHLVGRLLRTFIAFEGDGLRAVRFRRDPCGLGTVGAAQSRSHPERKKALFFLLSESYIACGVSESAIADQEGDYQFQERPSTPHFQEFQNSDRNPCVRRQNPLLLVLEVD